MRGREVRGGRDIGNEVTPPLPACEARQTKAANESGPNQNWTSLLLGSRDKLSKHFAFLPLKIDPPITEIFLLCWEHSCLISINWWVDSDRQKRKMLRKLISTTNSDPVHSHFNAAFSERRTHWVRPK
eukprot:sb/3475330/